MPQQLSAGGQIDEVVILGRIGAPYGIQGYSHVQSYSDPAENILDYSTWMIRKNDKSSWRACQLDKGRLHGQSIVVKLEGVSDRDAAQLLTGSEIGVHREALPVLSEGEYYWRDLEGLTVETTLGVVLGTVEYLYDNAGHTNMVVKNEAHERHIPFIEPDFVTKISLTEKKIIVDWDPDL